MPRPSLASLFPRFNLVRNRVVDRVVQLPWMSVKRHDVKPDVFEPFVRQMVGKRLDASLVPDAMRTLVRDRPDSYRASFAKAVRPLLDEVISETKSTYGLDVSTWAPGSDARRAVWSADLAPAEGGHAVAVVSLEPLADAEQAVADPRLLRMFFGAFPGRFGSLTDAMYLEMLNAGREVDGTPTDWLAGNWERLGAYNGKLVRDGAPLSGMQMLGWSSFVGVEDHFAVTVGDLGVQSALFVTTGVHAMGGIVPCTAIVHPDFPGGVVCVSLHFGRNLFPLGDMANREIAAPLFKGLFRAGPRLYRLYRVLVEKFGEERASRLLLDPAVAREVRDVWWREDFWVLSDTALLSILDATGGALLKDLRLFAPETVSTIESARFSELTDAAAFSQAVADGVAATETSGYSGPGRVEPPDPNAVVPDLASVLAGRAVQTEQTDPYARSAPIGEAFTSEVLAVEKLAADVDRSAIDSGVASDIHKLTRTGLDALQDPFERTTDELVSTLIESGVGLGVQETLSDLYVEALAEHQEFAAITDRLGTSGAKALAGLTLGAETYARMTAEVDGGAYLTNAVGDSVLGARAHWLAESAEAIQKRVAAADQTIETTSKERDAKEGALKEVEAQLSKTPDDSDLQARRDALRDEVAKLVVSERQAERDKSDAEDDTSRNDDAARDVARERKSVDRYLTERRHTVFEDS